MIRARKRFGQHFLHDAGVIARIVDAIAPAPGQHLVEIGPGQGALTWPVLERAGRLDVVEIDRDLARELAAAATDRGDLRIHTADALQFDFATLAPHGGRCLRVIGNLPYNVSTPLLFHLLTAAPAILDMHFMLQKEVVERMAAGPGSKTYGRLSVMLAAACRVEKLFTVGSGAFRPPPQVDSAIVRLTPWTEPPFPLRDPARFAKLVATAFMHRRKTLRNALATQVEAATFVAAGIDPSRRPETLSPAEFARLADATAAPSL